MRHNLLIIFTIVTTLFTACQTTISPSTIPVNKDVEFTLAPNQTAALVDSELTLRLIGVTGDQRCPSEVECAMSGPVSISLSAQMGGGDPVTINLQTLTSNDGRAPDIHFDGIEDRLIYAGYLIRVAGVFPYPTNFSDTIKDSEFRVNLIISQE